MIGCEGEFMQILTMRVLQYVINFFGWYLSF